MTKTSIKVIVPHGAVAGHSPGIEDSQGPGKCVALQFARLLKIGRVRREVGGRSACELVDIRRPATRCVPHKPSRFLRQYSNGFPGFSPSLAVIF